MATPIEATPVLRGKDAELLIRAIRLAQRPSIEEREVARKRADFVRSLRRRKLTRDR